MKKALLILSIIGCIVSSCHINSTIDNREEDKEAAEQVTDIFYALLKKEDYKGTYKLFSKKFFAVTDTVQLNDIYKLTIKETGPVDSCFIENWETHDVSGTDSKTEYRFVYNVKRNKNTRETIDLLKEESGVIRIIGYHVDLQPK